MRVTAMWLTLFLLLIGGSSCGYLDQDIFADDEAFAESFEVQGLSLSGVGMSSGCGGMGYLGHRLARTPTIRLGGYASLELEAMSITAMTDDQILESTNIGVIDESEAPPANRANLPAQAYYEQKAKRDRAIAETY